LHGEIVERRHWIGRQSFDLAYALSRITPGTNLLAFCTAVGWMLRSWFGAITATPGWVGPVQCDGGAAYRLFRLVEFKPNSSDSVEGGARCRRIRHGHDWRHHHSAPLAWRILAIVAAVCCWLIRRVVMVRPFSDTGTICSGTHWRSLANWGA
jgi:hypothetical protein